MKFKSLILLVVSVFVLFSCDDGIKFDNPNDINTDSSEIQKICERENAECGSIEIEYFGKKTNVFCGKCSKDYECGTDNKCADIDECADSKLNNCPENADCNNLDTKSDGKPYECICKENYSGDDCIPDSRTKECVDLPENAQWNTVSEITQTWSGKEWSPSNKGYFDEKASETECRFKCLENYDWKDSKCIAATQKTNCIGKPENAVWNTASSITQTWNGSEWVPTEKSSYNNEGSETECRFKCDTNYNWDGSVCEAATRTADCGEKSENSIWNDNGANGKFTQTWSGEEWLPASYDATFSKTAESCTFICDSGYVWFNNSCVTPPTQTAQCTGLPANAVWNSTATITQTYNGESWNPSSVGIFDQNPSSNECRFKCDEHYNWNSSSFTCDPETQTYTCSGKPANSSWNSVSSYTQTWNGNGWSPAASSASYNTTASTTECRFKCNEHYNWNSTDKKCDAAIQQGDCSPKPVNSVWNDNGKNGKFDQIWGGSAWNPATYASEYNETAGTCRYICDSDSHRESSECVSNTRTTDCPPKPENSLWNDNGANGTYTQTWTGSGWSPIYYTSTYDSGVCKFKCDSTHYYYRSECMSPCEYYAPCENIANSTNVCTAYSWSEYSCGCNPGYTWNGIKCRKSISLGNICTGQTQCYDNYNQKIDCQATTEDFYGQDALYTSQCTAQDFTTKTVSSQKIVVDNNTGLVWEQAASTEKYSWENAENHCTDLNNSNYAGYSDWRLPTPQELLSIVNNQYGSINSNFKNPNSIIWSSKKFYRFNPSGGHIDMDSQSTYPVFCVHGNQMPEGIFTTQTVNNKFVVIDSTTNLMWQKNYATQRNWSEALQYCENSTYADYSDWRLPNKNELASLLNYDKPESPVSYFPDMPSANFWSSTKSPGAWYIGFYGGTVRYSSYSDDLSNVICVRSDCDRNKLWNGSECFPNPCDSNTCDSTKENCEPITESSYECVCKDGYFKNEAEECVSPCDPNPCENDTHSNGVCTVINSDNFACGCIEGFSWNSGMCQELSTATTLGNICTGQDVCYSDIHRSNDIPCPAQREDFFGQDAQYRHHCTPQRFQLKTLADDDVILDRNTGLQWQRRFSTDSYSSWTEAYIYCDQLTYGTYSDWRLPTPQELLTTLDMRLYPFMAEYFYGTNTLFTSKKDNSNNPFIFGNYSGTIFTRSESDYISENAMCVRGKELPTASFTNPASINGDTVVTDSRTGLMWQGTYDTVNTWKEALSYCENLSYAGKSDWRLPNINELASLLNYDRASAPYSDFPDMPPSSFWSSTTLADEYNNTEIQSIDFYKGSIDRSSKNGEYFQYALDVRCVRYAENNDPCENHTCGELENSTLKCIPESRISYSCECSDGYAWNGSQCVILVLPECTATSSTPCKDSTSGFTWSSLGSSMQYIDAASYCRNLSEGGLRDWRLPTVSELRTLIQNCDDTVTGGICGITDDCLAGSCAYPDGSESHCEGCNQNSNGTYSKLGDAFGVWSSSIVSNYQTTNWYVYFSSASIWSSSRREQNCYYDYETGNYNYNFCWYSGPTFSVRCVR